jgi:hypothetical protein
MANIKNLLKELDLPENWERIECPTLYNDQIVPFGENPPECNGGFVMNGHIITRKGDGSVRWISMTVDQCEHVKLFDARFNLDGTCKDFDINFFGLGKEKNVVDDEYMKMAIKEITKYIKRNKDRFKIIQ